MIELAAVANRERAALALREPAEIPGLGHQAAFRVSSWISHSSKAISIMEARLRRLRTAAASTQAIKSGDKAKRLVNRLQNLGYGVQITLTAA